MCYPSPSPPTPPPSPKPKPKPTPAPKPAPAPKAPSAPAQVSQETQNPEWERVDKRTRSNMASGTAGEGEGYYGTWLSNDRRRRPTEDEQSNLGQSQGNLGFGTVLRKFLGG